MILNTEGGDMLVTFGSGDIIISHIKSIGEEDEHLGLRFNLAKKPHSIGDDVPCENVIDGDDDVYAHPAINIIFYKKESIDVLIEMLQEAKKNFGENENSSI